MDTIVKPEKCEHCNGTEIKLRKQVIANGTLQIAWRCMECNRWAQKPPIWLNHRRVESYAKRYKKTIDDIQSVADYTDNQPCIICREPGEIHHWAPQAYADQFDEWTKWPTAYLCNKHHKQWHSIVTPSLMGKKQWHREH